MLGRGRRGRGRKRRGGFGRGRCGKYMWRGTGQGRGESVCILGVGRWEVGVGIYILGAEGWYIYPG